MRFFVAMAGLAVSAVVAGCAAPAPDGGDPVGSVSAAPASVVPDAGDVAGGDADDSGDDDMFFWSYVERWRARRAAVACLEAYRARWLPQGQWWDGFSGTLVQSAAEDWFGTSVASVPEFEIVGLARQVPGIGEFEGDAFASVVVPTSVGDFTVVVVPPWWGEDFLVERIVFPEGAG